MEAAYETNIVDLPEGDFTVDVVQVNFNIIFSPDLVWNITNQWDSESETYGINSRIRWTIQPGSDLYFGDQSGNGYFAQSLGDDKFRHQYKASLELSLLGRSFLIKIVILSEVWLRVRGPLDSSRLIFRHH